MTFLEYAKQYHNFDVFLVLVDNAGYTDEEIAEKFEISKQRIYDAKKRVEPILSALEAIEPYKRDMRDKNIQSIVDAFCEAFGTTKASRYDRFAAKRLHVKYGAENIIKIIQALAAKGGERYAPVINNVSQLEAKWVQVGKFLNNEAENGIINL